MTGASLSGMLCVFSSLQCTGRGHAQNLFASRFALFQCILHAQLLLVRKSCDTSLSAFSLREAIQAQDTEATWPPKPSDLIENALNIPEVAKKFLYTLLTGSTSFSGMESFFVCVNGSRAKLKTFV